MILLFNKKTLVLLFLILCQNLKAQEIEAVNFLKHYRLDSASQIINKNKSPNLSWQNNFLTSFDTRNPEIQIDVLNSFPKNSEIEEIYNHINKGDVYFYKYLDKNIDALKEYQIALNLSENKNDTLLINQVLIKILTMHRLDILYQNDTYKTYLKKYKKTASNKLDKAYYHYYNLILNFKNYNTEEWDPNSYNYLNHYFKTNNTPYLKGISYTVYASFFEELNQKDSIWFYINKAEKEFLKIKENYPSSRLKQLYSFTARIAVAENNINVATSSLNKINYTRYNKIDHKIDANRYFYLAITDSLKGNYKEAMKHFTKTLIIADELQENYYTNLLNEFEVKYQTEIKEKQIIQQKNIIEKKQRQQRNLWIGGIITLLFGSVFGLLVYKNTKRKQLIAEKEREIEIQKKEKLLKDQELNTIDAMIEGQEKERQRLASDLHDSVGATLSAARLQFEHLCKYKGSGTLKNEDELYTKTGKLLEQVYQEIRSMAHLKNSGVIATKGLLPAIQKLARNASTPGGLQIEVEDFGLSVKIENSLEISIFRVIQELITNIIKHAQATEATISITQHEDSLSIIVEDNGIGFDVKKFIDKDGMGLSSIEKRIEHLEGSMEVDTNLGKGTNILIDIPILK